MNLAFETGANIFHSFEGKRKIWFNFVLFQEQQDVCRDVRRRGRNKAHALKCRQKKADELEELQRKIDKAKIRSIYLGIQHDELKMNFARKTKEYQRLQDLANGLGWNKNF